MNGTSLFAALVPQHLILFRNGKSCQSESLEFIAHFIGKLEQLTLVGQTGIEPWRDFRVGEGENRLRYVLRGRDQEKRLIRVQVRADSVVEGGVRTREVEVGAVRLIFLLSSMNRSCLLDGLDGEMRLRNLILSRSKALAFDPSSSRRGER